MSFNDLFESRSWKPIPNCPGRYVLAGGPADLSPGQLLGDKAEIREFQTSHARDMVVVASFDGGGIISYRRSNGAYLHTLNTPEGFARKLDQLGLSAKPG